jgi:ankyrin repeat protein
MSCRYPYNIVDEEGNTKLGRILKYNECDDDDYDDDEIFDAVAEDTDACHQTNYDYEYPLHIACGCGHSYDVVKEILGLNPEAATKKDRNGNYPIHCACQAGANSKVILLLLSKFPQTASEKNDDNCYPLHLAFENIHSDKVILKLLEAYPQIVREQDNEGNYPLNLAITNRQSNKVFLQLLKANPHAAREGGDCYALHLACLYKSSETVMLSLLDTHLLAVKVGEIGYRPVDLAKMKGHSEKIISILELLTAKTKFQLKNRIGVPFDVTTNGLSGDTQRHEMFHWLLLNTPKVDYVYLRQPPTLPPSRKRYRSF